MYKKSQKEHTRTLRALSFSEKVFFVCDVHGATYVVSLCVSVCECVCVYVHYYTTFNVLNVCVPFLSSLFRV